MYHHSREEGCANLIWKVAGFPDSALCKTNLVIDHRHSIIEAVLSNNASVRLSQYYLDCVMLLN